MIAPSVKEHHNLDETNIFIGDQSKPDATNDNRQQFILGLSLRLLKPNHQLIDLRRSAQF